MISLSGVKAVQTRIAEIQQEFGIAGSVTGKPFQATLDAELKKAGALPEEAQRVGVAQRPQSPQKTMVAQAAGGTVEAYPLADASLSSLVQEASSKFGVDAKLVSAVAEVESGGNQASVSEAGAIGVMQLMPDTARALGVNPYDEKENVEGGAKYLRQMLDTFGGDVKKAVAAYNAGPQAVKEYGGVPPYRETQNYVNKVLDIYQ